MHINHCSCEGNTNRMGLLTCLVLMLMSAHLIFASPVLRQERDLCLDCPPGKHQQGCECVPCPAGTYTSERNRENSCHRCFTDCRPDLHLKAVKNCTSTSNLQCECEDGFYCTDQETLSRNCRSCERIYDRTTTGQRSTSIQPCNSPQCSSKPPTGNATARTDTTKTQLIAILCPLLTIGCIALAILFCVRCPGQETRFKQTVKKLCNPEIKDTAHKPRETFDTKQPSVPIATANMGPVHVHNPGTVIFSLLSQFTGQNGPTKEEKTNMKVTSEDEMDCTVCQPTPSPSIPLSEEEHRGEADSIFFPSQEQGKDSRLSKEEEL